MYMNAHKSKLLFEPSFLSAHLLLSINRLRLDSSPPWSFNSFFCKKFEISKKFSYKSRIGLYKVVLDMQNDKYKEVL